MDSAVQRCECEHYRKLLAVIFGEKKMGEIPIIYATKEQGYPVDVFRFDCPKCGERHTHGYVEGHRVSHCHDPDLFPQGYILKEKRNEFQIKQAKP